MNLALVSGTVMRMRLWEGAGKHRFALLIIKSRAVGKGKRFNQFTVVCYGKVAQMCYDRLDEGAYVAVLGVLERRHRRAGAGWIYEMQIEARQIMLPLYPDSADWLQLAFLLAAAEHEPKEDLPEDEQDKTAPVLVGSKGNFKETRKVKVKENAKTSHPGATSGNGDTHD